eukprot:315-Eustigmatos_ZCMA.PRE.1
MAITAPAIASPSPGMRCTKLRSILSFWIGKRCRYASDEYPVPKSSIDRLMPAACSDSSSA